MSKHLDALDELFEKAGRDLEVSPDAMRWAPERPERVVIVDASVPPASGLAALAAAFGPLADALAAVVARLAPIAEAARRAERHR